jgi:hypothetical protein
MNFLEVAIPKSLVFSAKFPCFSENPFSLASASACVTITGLSNDF